MVFSDHIYSLALPTCHTLSLSVLCRRSRHCHSIYKSSPGPVNVADVVAGVVAVAVSEIAIALPGSAPVACPAMSSGLA